MTNNLLYSRGAGSFLAEIGSNVTQNPFNLIRIMPAEGRETYRFYSA